MKTLRTESQGWEEAGSSFFYPQRSYFCHPSGSWGRKSIDYSKKVYLNALKCFLLVSFFFFLFASIFLPVFFHSFLLLSSFTVESLPFCWALGTQNIYDPSSGLMDCKQTNKETVEGHIIHRCLMDVGKEWIKRWHLKNKYELAKEWGQKDDHHSF